MTKFYSQIRSQKGSAIGTIIPWAGDIGDVPIGWLRCDGGVISRDDYPELFEIIGYQYGGSGTSFTLPNLLNKALCDFHPSHANIPSLGYNTTTDSQFISRIGTDTANSIAGTTSNIDLLVRHVQVNSISGTVSGMNLNPVFYGDEVTIVPRVLSDHHTGSHSHGNTVTSVGSPRGWGERCQTDNDTNCDSNAFGIPDCSDECSEIQYWPSEESDTPEYSSYTRPIGPAPGDRYGSTPIVQRDNPILPPGYQPANRRGQLTLTNAPTKNYIERNDDALEVGANGNANYGYPVHLNHVGVNYGGGGSQTANYVFTGHEHPAVPFNITTGNVRPPFRIRIDNISTGNIQPANAALRGIASVRMPDINTPSLNVIHIIRAY